LQTETADLWFQNGSSTMLTAFITHARLFAMAAISIPVVIEDLRKRHIPNWSCAVLFACGVALGIREGGLAGFGSALAGAAAGFATFFVFYLMGAMGGGDVKLMAACGSLAGLDGVLATTVMTAIAGALIAMISLAIAAARHRRAESIAYAPAIVLGTLLALVGRTG
jgi:prepilin peptidase CpaA